MIIPHRFMLEDRVRCLLYQKAIRLTVKPGDVVCDIGTGTGLLSFFALQAGAKKVYALENTDIIEDAKRIAAQNNWQKKIIFIKRLSTKVNLPEKVDVIISEIIGYFALEERIIEFISDAKKRFLKKGGILIPSYLEMFIAPVENRRFHKDNIEFWSKKLYGIDYSIAKEEALGMGFVSKISSHQLLAKAQKIHSLNFYRIDNHRPKYVNKSCRFIVEKKGCLHGLAGWFKARLSDKILLSTSPKDKSTCWRNFFFPLKEALPVKRGDTLKVKLEARPMFKKLIWSWRVEIVRRSKTNDAGNISFSHSTIKNIIIPKNILRKLSKRNISRKEN